jgi:pyruvate,water dikinase
MLARLAASAGAAVRRPGAVVARGVAYSEDPREERVEELHIYVWAGKVVAGVPSTRYRMLRETVGDEGAVAGAVTVERDAGAAVVLSSAGLRSVVGTLRAAEAVLEEAIALAWVWDGADVVVVGVEPLDAPLPWAIYREAEEPGDGWTRANAGEVFPSPMTPLTWTLTGERLDHGFAAMFRKPAWTDGRRFVALFDGYLYFNFGLVYELNINRLGAPSRQTVNMVGGPGSMEGLRVSGRGLNPWAMLRNLPLIVGTTRRHQQLPKEWPERRQRLEEERRLLRALDVATLDDAALLRALIDSGDRQDDFFDFFMLAQSAAFATLTALSYLLHWFLGDEGLALKLVQGLPGIRTAEANLALWRLAERAAADPATAAAVGASEPGGMVAALRVEATTAWLADEINDYLATYGHRSAGELEYAVPRWLDDPTPLLQTFQQYVASPEHTNADALAARQVRRRREAEAEIDRRLTRHWWERIVPARRTLVRFYTRWAQAYSPLRENPKFSLLEVAYEQRRLLLTLSGRLVARGVLRERDDVFFLVTEELERLVARPDDRLLAGRMRSRARRRRTQYAIYAVQTPPPVWGVAVGEEEGEDVSEEVDGTTVLTGLGASPGVVEGRALVATTAAEGSKLQAGEILVAKFTDPACTPIFPLAGAVVTDIGGILSHGAIVAREYGIPAVVNVQRGTATIRSGQWLRVDGAAGTVTLLEGDSD